MTNLQQKLDGIFEIYEEMKAHCAFAEIMEREENSFASIELNEDYVLTVKWNVGIERFEAITTDRDNNIEETSFFHQVRAVKTHINKQLKKYPF